MPKIRQLPIIRYRILPDDVGGIIIADDLEIAVIRPYPSVLDLFDRHHQGIELDASGRFIDPVAGIALNSNFHVISSLRRRAVARLQSRKAQILGHPLMMPGMSRPLSFESNAIFGNTPVVVAWTCVLLDC